MCITSVIWISPLPCPRSASSPPCWPALTTKMQLIMHRMESWKREKYRLYMIVNVKIYIIKSMQVNRWNQFLFPPSWPRDPLSPPARSAVAIRAYLLNHCSFIILKCFFYFEHSAPVSTSRAEPAGAARRCDTHMICTLPNLHNWTMSYLIHIIMIA
jgi:hypothetical protein